jgi:hypothetical protein
MEWTADLRCGLGCSPQPAQRLANERVERIAPMKDTQQNIGI